MRYAIRWFKCKLKPPKNHNLLYSDIEINEDWMRSWQDADNDMYNGVFVNESDTAICVENDIERTPTYKQMPHINSGNSPLDSIDESDCNNSESENDKSKEMKWKKIA